jgi:hypothetical protein
VDLLLFEKNGEMTGPKTRSDILSKKGSISISFKIKLLDAVSVGDDRQRSIPLYRPAAFPNALS